MGLFKNNFNLFGAWVFFKANHKISKKEKEKRIVCQLRLVLKEYNP
jgi:hypothetical protein